MTGGADLLELPDELVVEVTIVVSFDVTETNDVKLEVIEVDMVEALCDVVVDAWPIQQCSQLGLVMH